MTPRSRGPALRLALALLVAAACVAGARAASGGSYTLSWFTVDGGGGASVGGSYALSGTIGQPASQTIGALARTSRPAPAPAP